MKTGHLNAVGGHGGCLGGDRLAVDGVGSSGRSLHWRRVQLGISRGLDTAHTHAGEDGVREHQHEQQEHKDQRGQQQRGQLGEDLATVVSAAKVEQEAGVVVASLHAEASLRVADGAVDYLTEVLIIAVKLSGLLVSACVQCMGNTIDDAVKDHTSNAE